MDGSRAAVCLARERVGRDFRPGEHLMKCAVTAFVAAPVDDYPRVIEQALVALLSEGSRPARARAPIAYPPREIARRPVLGQRVAGEVFQRDRFSCCYCGGEVDPRVDA
jgi:hypothetical protein